MNFSFFIAKRVAQSGEKSFSRFIIRLSIAATIISVAVMIITLSFVNGFQDTVSEKVFSFWGHVRIQYRQPQKNAMAEEVPIAQDTALEQRVKAMRGVRSMHAFATKYAILKTTNDMEGLLLKGFTDSTAFQQLRPFLEEGRWIRNTDSSYAREIVLSTFTTKQLQLKLHDKVLIYFVRPDGTLRPDKLSVVGIYKTGIEEYDKTFALSDMKLLRRLNGWAENEIGGYEVFLKDYHNMDAASYDIYEMPHFPEYWETKTVREIYPNIFDWLGIIGNNGQVLITIMIIIAAINFITCLIILVLERLRMIGTLKALGATDWSIQKIFLYHSVLITATGIVLGVGIAFLLMWLQQKTGFVRLDESAYYMQTAVVRWDWSQIFLVIIGTIVLSVLVLLVPSLLVKKIQPIKAIRFN